MACRHRRAPGRTWFPTSRPHDAAFTSGGPPLRARPLRAGPLPARPRSARPRSGLRPARPPLDRRPLHSHPARPPRFAPVYRPGCPPARPRHPWRAAGSVRPIGPRPGCVRRVVGDGGRVSPRSPASSAVTSAMTTAVAAPRVAEFSGWSRMPTGHRRPGHHSHRLARPQVRPAAAVGQHVLGAPVRDRDHRRAGDSASRATPVRAFMGHCSVARRVPSG